MLLRVVEVFFQASGKRATQIELLKEIGKAKDEEGVRNVWGLSNLELIGQYLYLQTAVDLAKAESIEFRRLQAKDRGKKLMKRCGFSQAFCAKHDYCFKFFQYCVSVFLFDAADMADMCLGARSNIRAASVSYLGRIQPRMDHFPVQ